MQHLHEFTKCAPTTHIFMKKFFKINPDFRIK